MSPKAGAHGEALRHDGDQSGDRGARRGRRAQRRSGARIRARHQSGDRGADRLRACARSRPAPTDASHRRRVEAALGPDVAAIMLTNPNTCGLFEREIVEIADGRACGGRLFLLRRRQFQRHRRQGAAGRPRRRRDAHQSAQDLLDPARRRRPGRRAGRAVGSASRPSRPCPCFVAEGGGLRLVEHTRGDAGLRPHHAPSTARWACSCARSPICCRMARTACAQASRGRGALGQLRARRRSRDLMTRALRRPTLHA